MKDELNCSYIGEGDAYLLQSVAIHFNHTVGVTKATIKWETKASHMYVRQKCPARMYCVYDGLPNFGNVDIK